MPVFQISDDVLDLSEAKGRGEIGSDIREGKRSVLVVYTAHQCTGTEAERMYDVLDKGREETTREEVEWVINLFRKYGAEEAARRQGETLLARAQDLLEGLPSDLRSNLTLASRYLMTREA
jgi:geranylgeranyl pyrophosphate synthase